MRLLSKYYNNGVPHHGHLFGEGVVVAILGTLFAWWLFPAEASLVSVFLASISTIDSIERVLDANRLDIFERHIRPLRANARLILLVLALFAGTTIGFSILGLGLPLAELHDIFSHQLEDYSSESFTELSFGGFSDLLILNIYVLLFFFIIAIPFRQGGVMLAVAWNASVWGATFGFFARSWSDSGGPPTAEAYLRVMATVTPHMAIEACAYVIAGFAGVFVSKGILKHELDSDVMLSIGKTILVMMALAAMLVVIGALWESQVAPILLTCLGASL